MPKLNSRVSDKNPERTYSGEKEGRDVVGWLNHHLFEDDRLRQFRRRYEEVTGERVTFRDPQNRVIQILRLYEESRSEWEDRILRGMEPSISNSRKKESAYRKLERRLRRYTFYPQFFPAGKLFSFAWLPTRPDRPDRYGEVSAIADLAKLAERDLLGHLKECRCGKWTWARFSHQRFCSAKCRESEFRSSEKWKEHRRQKAREYYRLHKSGKVK